MLYKYPDFITHKTIEELISTSKSIEHCTNIDEQPRRHEYDERHHGGVAVPTVAAAQQPQLDLHDVHQRQHQENRPAHRPDRRHHVPDPERHLVDVGQIERPENPVVVVLVVAAAG